MANWAPVVVSVIALLFATFSFWWMNWRPAKLEVGDLKHFAAGKATEGVADNPNVVIVTLPLILYNSGARSVVIESMRLVGTRTTTIGKLEFERVDSHLGIVPTDEKCESDYFFLPVALKPNEVIKRNFVFERRTQEFAYGNLLYHLHLEAKLSGNRNWMKLKDIELDFQDQEKISPLGLNLIYQVFHYRVADRA